MSCTGRVLSVAVVLVLAGCSGGFGTPTESGPESATVATLERVELRVETTEIGEQVSRARATVPPQATRTTVRHEADGTVTNRTATLPANWSGRLVGNLADGPRETPALSRARGSRGRRLTATLRFETVTVEVSAAFPGGPAHVTVDDAQSYYTDDAELETVLRQLADRLIESNRRAPTSPSRQP